MVSCGHRNRYKLPRRGLPRAGVYADAMSELTDRAQELLNGRMAVLERLGEAQADVSSLNAKLKEAEDGQSAAWSDATSVGWTTTELRALGLVQPASKRGGRPAKPARAPSGKRATSE